MAAAAAPMSRQALDLAGGSVTACIWLSRTLRLDSGPLVWRLLATTARLLRRSISPRGTCWGGGVTEPRKEDVPEISILYARWQCSLKLAVGFLARVVMRRTTIEPRWRTIGVDIRTLLCI
jgi:hypothetical protein